MIKFDMPKNQSSIIKVIGVGGGGSNAVNHMFTQGIEGVDFLICNTDAQAMETSVIPTRFQLGDSGLGAGAIPSVGRESALQRIEEIREILQKNTKMLFITAGMGGGTGTGAAPVIASVARELDILTVGIVTIPFAFEGRKRRLLAEEGIQELKEHVDTLLIICNDKLRELYGDLKLSEAFQQADNVLTTAAKGIDEIITVTGYINVDFEDVKTVMKNSGKAIMGSAQAEGQNRATEAIKAALSSPLLNDNDIEGASNILLYITSGAEEISMDEVTEITDYIQNEAGSESEIIWGNGIDESLHNKISITLIATGFDAHIKKKARQQENKITHTLTLGEDNNINTPPVPEEAVPEVNRESIELIRKKPHERVLDEDILNVEESEEKVDMEPISLIRKDSKESGTQQEEDLVKSEEEKGIAFVENKNQEERTFVFSTDHDESGKEKEETVDATLDIRRTFEFEPEIKEEKPSISLVAAETTTNEKKPFEVYIKKPGSTTKDNGPGSGNAVLEERTKDRIEKLKNLSFNLKSQNAISELEDEPAYMRRNVDLDHSSPSKESSVSKYALYEDEEKGAEIKSNNAYLHDNID